MVAPLLSPLLWPLAAAASASRSAAGYFDDLLGLLARESENESNLSEPQWATPNAIALELPTMRLRDFSAGTPGPATLLCAPYALHGATIADFAPGHSIVEALRNAGIERPFLTDWRSATQAMGNFSIDTYLADINVAVDTIGTPVDLIGLCQGGWMALVYAARFPAKVRRLVLVGAPVDVHTVHSSLSRFVVDLPMAAFENLVRLGGGRVLGRHVLEFWSPALTAHDTGQVLQFSPDIDPQQRKELTVRFHDWYAWTVDLPGTYYLQVVRQIFKENQVAQGCFMALGRQIDLAEIRTPLLLLAGRDDELVAPAQLLATVKLIGTPPHMRVTMTEPCSHLSLFMGARTLARAWRQIVRWLRGDLAMAEAS